MKYFTLLFAFLISCEIETDNITVQTNTNGGGNPTPVPLDTSSTGDFRTGNFVGKTGHSASGTVTVTQTESGLSISFHSNFSVQSGPDLVVTLASNSGTYSPTDKELGRLSSFSGAQTYTISGVTLSEYNYVHVWCKSFNPVFGSAQLGSVQ